MKTLTMVSLGIVVAIVLIGTPVTVFGGGAAEEAEPDQYVVSITMLSIPVYQEAPKAFMEYVEEASDGRIVFEDFLMGTLGSDDEVMEMVYHGEIDITTGQIDAGLSSFAPSVQAMSAPFMFSSWRSFVELMDTPFFEELRQQVLDESDGNLRILAAMKGSARRTFTVNGPIRTPDDIVAHNVRMRTVEAPMHMALWEALGASTVAIPSEERYMAAQTGLADGFEGGLGSAIEYDLIEFTRYTAMTDHIVSGHFFVAIYQWYQSLPADLQAVIDEGARIAAEVQNQHVPQASERALEIMRERGVEIIELTPEEVAQWREIAEPVGLEILADEVDTEFMRRLQDAVAEVEAGMGG